MAVNAKERAALEKMWDDAKASGGADLPDGDYTFVITKAKPNMSDKGMPSFQSVCKIVDGPEAFIGQEVPVRDNLGSADNMGWFKKKLARLGIEVPAKDEMIRQLMNKDDGEGSVAAAMVGKKFSGQAKTKNDFLNIYVNKLLGTEEVSAEEETPAPAKGKAAAAAKATDEETDGGDEKVEKDDTVTFVSKNDGPQQGVVLELLEGGKTSRVQVTDDKGETYDGKIYKLPTERLTIVYEDQKADAADETEETEEEEAPKAAAKGKGKRKAFPTRAEIEDLRLPELKETLAEHGFEVDDIKSPRQFASGVAGFIEDGKDYQPELAELPALCAALDVKYKKGEAPKAAIKALRETIEERFA